MSVSTINLPRGHASDDRSGTERERPPGFGSAVPTRCLHCDRYCGGGCGLASAVKAVPS